MTITLEQSSILCENNLQEQNDIKSHKVTNCELNQNKAEVYFDTIKTLGLKWDRNYIKENNKKKQRNDIVSMILAFIALNILFILISEVNVLFILTFICLLHLMVSLLCLPSDAMKLIKCYNFSLEELNSLIKHLKLNKYVSLSDYLINPDCLIYHLNYVFVSSHKDKNSLQTMIINFKLSKMLLDYEQSDKLITEVINDNQSITIENLQLIQKLVTLKQQFNDKGLPEKYFLEHLKNNRNVENLNCSQSFIKETLRSPLNQLQYNFQDEFNVNIYNCYENNLNINSFIDVIEIKDKITFIIEKNYEITNFIKKNPSIYINQYKDFFNKSKNKNLITFLNEIQMIQNQIETEIMRKII